MIQAIRAQTKLSNVRECLDGGHLVNGVVKNGPRTCRQKSFVMTSKVNNTEAGILQLFSLTLSKCIIS
jgi:hypothetical protein